MLFNFERDHTEIHEKVDDSIEYKYLREFYLRLNSRGIYSNDISNKKSYKAIENELNSKITLTILSCNTILSSNDENYLNYVINSIPTSLYKLFLKCSMYQMKDFAVHLLVNNWPFEKLELIEFFKEAYSSLLFFYKTDINSFTGKIAPEILKWLLISSKYTKLVTKIFLKNQIFESYKLRHLDITGLPISDRLFKELLNKYYHSVSIFSDEFNSKSPVSSISDDNSSLTSRIVSYSDQEGNSESENDSDFSEDISSEGSLSSASDFDFKTFFKKCLKNKEIENNDCSIKSQYLEQFDKIEKYDIKLDLILVSFNAWQKFMKIAQIKSINKERNINKANYEFKLIVNKLDITFHQQKFCLENDFLDPEVSEITGLGIFFSANFNEVMYTFNLIKKFKNIQDLNLSAFGRESLLNTILDNGTTTEALKNSLSELKNLKRLRLNIPGCKNKLKLLLENLSRPLEYLNLTSCGLNENDLKFLMESIHVNTIDNLVLSNNDLNAHSDAIICLLKKMKSNLQILDLGCNSFSFDVYYKILNEGISCLTNLRLLVTLDVFTFENYLRIAERLSFLKKFISWRINYSSDYYEKSVKIKNKYKFRKFKNDYIEALERKFMINSPCNHDNKMVKLTINDPDLNYILNEIF